MRRINPRLPLAALALSLVLAGCDSNGNPIDPGPIGGTPTPAPAPAPTPAPSPTPSPSPAPTRLNVTRCLNQQAVPGRSVASLVVPDVIRMRLDQPAGFPNGRRLQDPVIDVTLAVLFLDLTQHSPVTLAGIPINPAGNDLAFRAAFPYLALPHGTAPPPGMSGRFRFRDEPAAAYTRVDRMGMPAVATALVSSPQKNAYNDDSPAQDATGKWAPEFIDVLSGLATALADDFGRAGLSICAQ